VLEGFPELIEIVRAATPTAEAHKAVQHAPSPQSHSGAVSPKVEFVQPPLAWMEAQQSQQWDQQPVSDKWGHNFF
jgi:hypothetical protein